MFFSIFLFCSDLLQVAALSSGLEDPSLQPLIPDLIDLLLHSNAANTVQKDSNGWQKWKFRSVSKLSVPTRPALPLQVSLYLTELVQRAVREGLSVSVVESAAYSIRWGHRLAGMDSPTDHPLVKGVVERARRKLARPVQPKQPLSHDIIAEITQSLHLDSASLAHIRFLFILLVGYAGLFRISEILNIRVNDVSISTDFMQINLIKRNNDQYRDGHVSVIARSRKPTCPVGITERLLSLLPDSKGSNNPIVRRIVSSKKPKECFHGCLGISYSTAYGSFKSFSPFISDSHLYGTHSIRVGGANDPGFRSLNSALEDRHVGWKNPKSKLRYTNAIPDDLLKVTRLMNI